MTIDGLTPQQYRAAELVALGKNDKEIAATLRIGVHGVSYLVRQIASRWNLHNGNVRVLIARRVQQRPAQPAA